MQGAELPFQEMSSSVEQYGWGSKNFLGLVLTPSAGLLWMVMCLSQFLTSSIYLPLVNAAKN